MACCSAAAIGIIPIHHINAQEGEWPSNADTYPGQIVYSRDVPYGTATRRFDQGEASTVSPDQSVLITDSLLVGLEPLSDAEQALVSAPLGRALDTTRSALQFGLSALSSPHSSQGDFIRAESGSTTVGGVIGNSLSLLPSSLGVIGEALGDGE
jgi:hypothetical protein